MYGKSNNARLAKILQKRTEFEESNPRHQIEKSIQDLHRLENAGDAEAGCESVHT